MKTLKIAGVLLATVVVGLHAADRREITFADARIFPESLTSTKDGTLYFGSLGQDAVYRATPNESKAVVFIPPKSNGLQSVLGVFADEKAGTLWVCASTTGGRGAPVVGETALKAFNLKTGAFKASYAFPNNGLCNDVAVAKDGTIYVADTAQGRVLRLKKGATALDVWASDPVVLATVDGLAILDDGALYANSVGQGTLMRIPIKTDGSAGAIAKLEPSRPLQGPDGMRTVGKMTLLLVEGGRLDEVTIRGDKAEVKVIREGMPGITAVTLTGKTAYVAEARLNERNTTTEIAPFRAIGIPYPAQK
ncbi:MAG TPA: hypothetical protein VFD21_07790 [Vicinamibacterales bacterium]|jgi:sugar lactone lactonase YvrE|nr:hypothetical protein [Vicinamibacterales bacterium]